MAKSSPRQRRTEGRVMHEFKHGELKSGPGGKGGKVKSRKQAVAIALNEAGASKYNSSGENQRSRSRTAAKETHGQTAQQEREGKSHLGAKGRRESTPPEGGKNAQHFTAAAKRGPRAARRSTKAARATASASPA